MENNLKQLINEFGSPQVLIDNWTEDFKGYESATKAYKDSFGIDPIPQEPFPKDVKMVNTMLGSAQNYNFFKWSDLFNQRQLLTVLTFADEIRKTINELKEKENDIEYFWCCSLSHKQARKGVIFFYIQKNEN